MSATKKDLNISTKARIRSNCGAAVRSANQHGAMVTRHYCLWASVCGHVWSHSNMVTAAVCFRLRENNAVRARVYFAECDFVCGPHQLLWKRDAALNQSQPETNYSCDPNKPTWKTGNKRQFEFWSLTRLSYSFSGVLLRGLIPCVFAF